MIRALFVGVIAAAAMVASADASTPSPVLVGLQRTGMVWTR